MKGAPNWSKPGDAVAGVWKAEVLRWLGHTFDIKCLVETGTCEGYTPYTLRDDFTSIHTVELSPYYYNRSRERLKDFKHIRMYRGDSRDTLPFMLENCHFEERILFWLDGHPSGGKTADAGDPLPEELRIITTTRPDSLIVIDDLRDADLRHVTEQGVNLDGWFREYRTGLVLMHGGGYIIPPFEV